MTTLDSIKQDEIYKAAHDYSIYVKKGIYTPNTIELKNKLSNDRHNNFIDEILRSKPREYTIEDFELINDNEIIEIFSKLVFMIFGFNTTIEDDLKYFIYNFEIRKSQFNSPLDGALKIIEYPNMEVKYKTYIPNLNTVSSIICLLHEFAHFVVRKHNLNFNNKYYYEEIMSILFEKIGIEILNNEGIGKGIQQKIENVRISSIYYHYKIKILEYNSLFRILRNDKDNAKEIEKIIKEIILFETALSNAYSFGYIYSENLLQKFIEDPELVKFKLQNILFENITLQQVLDYYDINIKNKSTVECAKRKVRKMIK